jgi:hypothetical protein
VDAPAITFYKWPTNWALDAEAIAAADEEWRKIPPETKQAIVLAALERMKL